MLNVADVIESLCDFHVEGESHPLMGGVVDSRQAYTDCIFIALPGEHQDGHDFIGEAFANGAYLAITQMALDLDFPQIDLRNPKDLKNIQVPEGRFCLLVNDSLVSLQQIARFWRKKFDLKVIGITGSVGKSTTKELVAEVLSQRFATLKNQGNLNNEIGLPLSILSINEHHQRAVLEMGFYVPGEIALLCDIALPQIGVITNIGTVHAERAGSQAEIVRGKSELVESLPPAPDGIAILNYDDPLVKDMASKTEAKVFFYGLDPRCDLWADHIESLGLDGIRFRLHFHNEVIHLRVPLIGRHSVHTVLRAAAVGLVDGLTWQEIVGGLRSEQAQLRLVTVHTPNGALILDDTYNASPESTLAALNLLDELNGRKIAVLGDMLELGPYERQGHEMVGARSAEVVDLLITVGSRARMIAEAARLSGLSPHSILEMDEVMEVTEYLKDKLLPGDVVLVKGSHGMRMDRIVIELEVRS
jgi:UDP-N-acetylmuramoyl-tripeptide--D-alanyl-D-alanine ligase